MPKAKTAKKKSSALREDQLWRRVDSFEHKEEMYKVGDCIELVLEKDQQDGTASHACIVDIKCHSKTQEIWIDILFFLGRCYRPCDMNLLWSVRPANDIGARFATNMHSQMSAEFILRKVEIPALKVDQPTPNTLYCKFVYVWDDGEEVGRLFPIIDDRGKQLWPRTIPEIHGEDNLPPTLYAWTDEDEKKYATYVLNEDQKMLGIPLPVKDENGRDSHMYENLRYVASFMAGEKSYGVGDMIRLRFDPRPPDIFGCIVEIRCDPIDGENFHVLVCLFTQTTSNLDDAHKMWNLRPKNDLRLLFATDRSAWVDKEKIIEHAHILPCGVGVKPPSDSLYFMHVYTASGALEPVVSGGEIRWPRKAPSTHDWDGPLMSHGELNVAWDISAISVSTQHIFESTGLDLFVVCEAMVSALGNKEEYKALVSQQGPQAQSWLNLLRQLLDCSLDKRARSLFSRALNHLSKNTNLHPDCLVLDGLETELRQVARGGFGDVYKGILLGQTVSVKVLRMFESTPPYASIFWIGMPKADVVQALYRESIVWSQLRHPHVLPLYGTYYLDALRSQLCLVSPWMEHGNIIEFLRNFPDANRLTLALDIAQGIAYLHQNNVIHGDLKGLNILVTSAGRACIADFGISTISDSHIIRWTSLSSASARGGTTRYQAPEILRGGKNTRLSDIYAFACVCYEMFAGHPPHPDLRIDGAIVYRVMVEDKRPARPPSSQLIDPLWTLIEDCWRTNPDDRPSADSVVFRLVGLTETDNLAASDWDDSFLRTLRSKVRDESLLRSLEELKPFFAGKLRGILKFCKS